jgi:hypothetical protein
LESIYYTSYKEQKIYKETVENSRKSRNRAGIFDKLNLNHNRSHKSLNKMAQTERNKDQDEVKVEKRLRKSFFNF